MRKFWFTLLLSLAITLLLPAPHGKAQTSPDIQTKIEEAKRQRDILLEEQKRLQASLDQISKQGADLQTTVKSLDTTRSKLATDLKITQNKISVANLTLDELTANIDTNQNTIEAHKTAIRESLRKLDAYDGQSPLLNVLTYGKFDELWTDTFNLMSLQDQLKAEISNLNAAQAELLANKNNKEREKSNLLSYSSELKGQKQAVDDTRQSQAALLLATKNKESEYQRLLAANIAAEKKSEEDLFRYESQLKTNFDPSSIPGATKGLLSWPLTSVTITQYFGYTSEAARLYRTTAHHNGIDLRASIGTPVMAALDGTVTDTENVRTKKGCQYGKFVLINHGNGLSTIYGHLSSVIVAPGEPVTTGEIIGYSGATGYATGPHLHFGVYVTAGVSIVNASALGSTNCAGIKTVAAPLTGYLDPLAYLPAF